MIKRQTRQNLGGCNRFQFQRRRLVERRYSNPVLEKKSISAHEYMIYEVCFGAPLLSQIQPKLKHIKS
jgi:hypothetical protein